jgi:hypothetical protein
MYLGFPESFSHACHASTISLCSVDFSLKPALKNRPPDLKKTRLELHRVSYGALQLGDLEACLVGSNMARQFFDFIWPECGDGSFYLAFYLLYIYTVYIIIYIYI